MLELIKTNARDPNFINLVKMLDKELSIQDGDEHDFYMQFNKLDDINHAIVAYENNIAVGIGSIKEMDEQSIEVKRMYVVQSHRGMRIATKILRQLELWSKDLGYNCCKLETGLRQPDAIALYLKNGYVKILNYGQYIGIGNSVCFEKILT